MMRSLFLFSLFPFISISYATDCYVTPCTRDVIFAVDNSATMQTTEYVKQQLSFLSSLTAGWTLSADKVRVAVFGYLFLDNYEFNDYFTESVQLNTTYSNLQYKSQLQGVFPGNFSEYMWVLNKYYVQDTRYPVRGGDVQKRIVVFTSETNQASLNTAAQYSASMTHAGYHLTIVSMVSQQAAFNAFNYHKFYYLPLASLANPLSSLRGDIINNGICFWEVGRPQTTPHTCPTTTVSPSTAKKSTTPAYNQDQTTPPPAPTHPPVNTEADYLNCSCLPANIWLDVVFVIDVSASMTDSGLTEVKADITTLVGQMTLDKSVQKSLRVGLVTFADVGTIIAGLDAFDNLDSFFGTLWGLQATDKETLDIEDGLRKAESVLLGNGKRDKVPDVIVVYSSAYASGGANDPVPLSHQLKESGMQIVTVAFVQKDESGIVLKMSELASPRMSFTSYQNDRLLDDLIDGFCQCNCFCPSEWHQLVIQDRKFGECYFLNEIDADWIASKEECAHLLAQDGMLVFMNSHEKEEIVRKYADKKRADNGMTGNAFHIGLRYNATRSKYIWDTVGVEDSLYINWAPNYPDASKGNCVRAVENNSEIQWMNEDCYTANTRAMCMSLTCDTQNYCGS